MKYLVFCVCGHSLESHDAIGCFAVFDRLPCGCTRSQADALDAAIDRVRADTHMQWSPDGEPTGPGARRAK